LKVGGPAISVNEKDLQEDRYSRLRLIPWWDQKKIRDTRVLVVGAGALGNEILKNLALLGFQRIAVMDMDRIEESNLSRAVLFRSQDVGAYKVEAAARGVRVISPDSRVLPILGNVLHDAGLGLFARSDLIIAGLDNREARLFINRCAWKMNRPWIDGAIEGINGVARAFLPGQVPCYECTLGATDWELLERRMSCNLLLREANVENKVATTPTTSSIIAGIQVQEAVKLIHGMPTLGGQGFVFEGLNHTSYRVEYTANPECLSHYTLEEIIELPEPSRGLTLSALHERAQRDLAASEVTVEFSRDVVHKLVCPGCQTEEEFFVPVGTLSYDQGRCSKDQQMRVVHTVHTFAGTESYGLRTLDRLGLPLLDVFTARSGDREIGYLLAGDAPEVFGAQGELWI
jgi:molybdopterin/thiamine biosynthesis adenylyltransferase